MSTDEPRLTPARRKALARLFVDRQAKISNFTGQGRIYWQVAEWLVDNGYARKATVAHLEITAEGDRRAALGLNIPEALQ